MLKNGFTFTGVIVKQGKSYTSLCLELDVASQGDTIRAAKDALIEAAALYLESAIDSNLPYLRPVPPDEDPRRATPKLVVQTFPLKVNIAVRAYA
jgi:predicted RNase H-like HicB family nuclease